MDPEYDIEAMCESSPGIHPDFAARMIPVLDETFNLRGCSNPHVFHFIRAEAIHQVGILMDAMFPEAAEGYARIKAAYRDRQKKSIPARLRKVVLERDGYRCRLCGSHIDLHADHVTPESKGGPTTLDNLQCLCGACNTRKSNKIEG